MRGVLLKCDLCGWERASMTPRADAKARAAHAKTHKVDAAPVVAPIPSTSTPRPRPAPRPNTTRRSSWDDREEPTWIDKL